MRRRSLMAAGNAVDEQRMTAVQGARRRYLGTMGELPEDIMNDRAIRGPMFGPSIRDFAPGYAPVIGPTPSNMPGTSAWLNPYKFVTYPLLASSAGALKIVTANLRRAYLLVQNKDVAEIYINFGTNPTIANSFTIAGGGAQEFVGGSDGGAFCPQEDVYVLGSTAAQIVVAGEGYRLAP